MSIGIIAALPQEFATVTGKRLKKNVPGKLDNGLSGIISGVGADNACQAAENLLAFDSKISGIISWGVAAGIAPEIASGTVCIPDTVIAQNGNKMAIEGALRSHILRKTGPAMYRAATVYTETETVLATQASKKALYNQTHAHLADMESGALHRFTRDNKLDFCIIRAVSDDAASCIPNLVLKHTNEEGEVVIPALIAALLVTPGQWISMLNLGRSFYKAKKNLQKIGTALFPNAQ